MCAKAKTTAKKAAAKKSAAKKPAANAETQAAAAPKAAEAQPEPQVKPDAKPAAAPKAAAPKDAPVKAQQEARGPEFLAGSAPRFLAEKDLPAWLAELAGSQRVLVPTQDGDAVMFRPYDAEGTMVLDRQATQPPKAAVFPASEPIVKFQYRKGEDEPGQVDVQIEPTIHPDPTVVFGGRPCDARGFTVFDRVYDSDEVQDTYYIARRQATAFISMVCEETDNTCFCHWVGSGPADTFGSDVLATPVEGGFTLQAVTEKGADLLQSGLLQDATDAQAKAAAQTQETALSEMGDGPDISDAPEKLLALFDEMGDDGFWVDVSSKCISCGACTYLCPTCYCFNITDETCGGQGLRIRSWDNCMSHLFTLEGSGHNPRPTKAHRLKNRVGHKFSYYPTLHEGVIACCGCGRCVKSCPVSVDIREIVQKAVAASPAKAE